MASPNFGDHRSTKSYDAYELYARKCIRGWDPTDTIVNVLQEAKAVQAKLLDEGIGEDETYIHSTMQPKQSFALMYEANQIPSLQVYDEWPESSWVCVIHNKTEGRLWWGKKDQRPSYDRDDTYHEPDSAAGDEDDESEGEGESEGESDEEGDEEVTMGGKRPLHSIVSPMEEEGDEQVTTGGKRPLHSIASPMEEEEGDEQVTTGGKRPLHSIACHMEEEEDDYEEEEDADYEEEADELYPPPSECSNELKQYLCTMVGRIKATEKAVANFNEDLQKVRTDLWSHQQSIGRVGSGSQNDNRKIRALNDRVGDLERRFNLSENQDREYHPMHDRPQAEANRPTQTQIHQIAVSADAACYDEQACNSIATLMQLGGPQREAFLKKRLVINLEASEVKNITLWRLYFFVMTDGKKRASHREFHPEESDFTINYEHAKSSETANRDYFNKSPSSVRSHSTALTIAAAAATPSSSSLAPAISPSPQSTPSAAPGHRFGESTVRVTPGGQSYTWAPLGKPPAITNKSPAASSTLVTSVDTMHVASYTNKFGEQPTHAMLAANAKYNEKLKVVASKILPFEAREDRMIANGGVPQPRHADVPKRPQWTQTACTAASECHEADHCAVCDKRGLLHDCAGCGNWFHFACCDAERPPPGDGERFLCGRVDLCKWSAWREISGWRPEPVPTDTFECVGCTQTHNTGLAVKLTSACECADKGNRICIDCVHKMHTVGSENSDVEKLACPFCNLPADGHMLDGKKILFSSMNGEHANIDNDDERQAAVSASLAEHQERVERRQARRPRLTHAERQVEEATQAATVESVYTAGQAEGADPMKVFERVMQATDVDTEALNAVATGAAAFDGDDAADAGQKMAAADPKSREKRAEKRGHTSSTDVVVVGDDRETSTAAKPVVKKRKKKKAAAAAAAGSSAAIVSPTETMAVASMALSPGAPKLARKPHRTPAPALFGSDADEEDE